jgi:hypothetical protein
MAVRQKKKQSKIDQLEADLARARAACDRMREKANQRNRLVANRNVTLRDAAWTAWRRLDEVLNTSSEDVSNGPALPVTGHQPKTRRPVEALIEGVSMQEAADNFAAGAEVIRNAHGG